MMNINFNALKEYTSTEEEYDMWVNYFSNPSVENRNVITEYYLPDIIEYAKAHHRKTNGKVCVDEFMSVLSEALMKGVQRYRPHNAKFMSFMDSRLNGAALDYLRKINPLTRLEQEFDRDRKNTINILRSSSESHRVDDETIATNMDIDFDRYKRLRSLVLAKKNINVSVLHEEKKESSDVSYVMLDKSKREDASFEEIDSADTVKFIIDSLGRNSKQKICMLYYFVEGRTYRDVARSIGCTTESVKNYINDAIDVIRYHIKHPHRVGLDQDRLISD